MVCFKFLHPKFSNNTNKHKLKKQSAKVGIFQAFSADCMGTNSEGVLPHLPPQSLPVQEVPQADFRNRRNRNAPHAPFSAAVVLGDLSLRRRQTGYLCISAVQHAGDRVRKRLVFAETNPQSHGTAGCELSAFWPDGDGRRLFRRQKAR